MHDYSVIFFIMLLYLMIPAVLIFFVIWFLTKSYDITNKIIFVRVLPFGVFLIPGVGICPTGEGTMVPALTGIFGGSNQSQLSSVMMILVTIAILFFLYKAFINL